MAAQDAVSKLLASGALAATPTYADTPGLCKAATLAEIEAQGWSLNPGRYVGVAAGEEISDETAGSAESADPVETID